MGVDVKPTNNVSQTSKFAVFITVMILLLCCGGLVRIELILNDRVEHLEAQIQSIEADTNRSAETVDPESLTVSNSKEHHNQNSSSFVQEQKKQDKSKEDNKVCGHGECILEETNKEYDEVHSHARRTRRALSLSLLLNHTLEKMEMELTSIIYQRVQKVVLTQKEFDEFVNQRDTKLINELNVKINHEIQKVAKEEIRGSHGTRGRPGRQGDRGIPGPKGEKGNRGSYGVEGIKGRKGSIGGPGPKGMKGDGLRGFKGSKGEKGQKGNSRKGVKGTIGPPGFKGFEGGRGNDGMRGPDGVRGFSGRSGMKGDFGFPGRRGVCRRYCLI